MTKARGSRIGPYEILGLIGIGGMGEVYRAHDTRLGRDVAIKFLPEELIGDPDRRARFEREARHLASLSHAHIAALYGLEESADGATGLVLELVEGPTLAERLRGGALSVPEALRFAAQIAEALAAAHEAGIVHRDLKPANIKLKAGSVVKVLDFGLAKTLGRRAERDGDSPPTVTSGDLTRAGTLLGTPAYMSPEQTRGSDIDRRADVWAFGCVLYELLTGRPAFAGDHVPDTIAAVLRSEPDWSLLPADLPPGVLTLLRRCLEKDATRRLRDLGDTGILIADSASRPESSGARPLSASALATRRRWPIAPVAGAGALVVGAAIVAFYLGSLPDAAPASAPSQPAAVPEAAAAGGTQPQRLPNSIAVLPLANLSSESDDTAFAVGLHEEILNQLTKLRSLTVISRSSVLRYADNRPPIPEIAEQLRVQAVMEGSVRYAGSELMVTAQLVDPATDAQLWSDTFRADRGNVEQLFAIQIEIAANIAQALGAEITADDRERIERMPTESASAYAHYLRSRDHFEKAAFGAAHRELDLAIADDPQFAEAYALRAWLYAYGQITSPARSAFVANEALRNADFQALALADASRALEIYDGAGVAWLARAVNHMFHLRYRDADAAFARAIELGPNDPFILSEYATFRLSTGNIDDALSLILRAERSDPNGSVTLSALIQILLAAGRVQEGVAYLDKAVVLHPDTPVINIFAAISAPDAATAVPLLRRIEENAPATNDGWVLQAVAVGYGSHGFQREAEAAFDRWAEWGAAQQVGAGEWAQYYLLRGDIDRAHDSLAQAVDKLEGGEADAGFFALQSSFLSPAAFGRPLDPRLMEPRFERLIERLRALTAR